MAKGYPFFIQQLCQIVFQNTDSKEIGRISGMAVGGGVIKIAGNSEKIELRNLTVFLK